MHKVLWTSYIFLILALVASTGCSARGTGRTEIDAGNKKITVLETKAPGQTAISADNDFEIKKIDRYEGVKGEGWLNEDTLLTARKSNVEGIGGSAGNLKNLWELYSYDLKSKKETIFEKTESMGLMDKPILSPDGKHLFSSSFRNGKITGLIFDLGGGVQSEVANEGFMLPHWADNDEVKLTTRANGVLFMNVNSQVTKVENFGIMQTEEAFRSGNKIYYISTDRKLMAYDISTKQRKTVKGNVLNFTLSPQKNMLAIEKGVNEGGEALTLIDLGGNEKATVAEAKMFFGVSWSPDQSKLAYAITSEDKSKAGLYVTDLASKKSLYTSPDFVGIVEDPVWSPSGKKILTTIQEAKGNEMTENTYIISLSGFKGLDNSNQTAAVYKDNRGSEVKAPKDTAPAGSKEFPAKVSFEKYAGLLGLYKEKLISTMNEIPDTIDEGGLEFRNAGFRVWFDNKNNNVARQIFTQNKDVDFNGAKIGDKLDKFVEVFGKPVVKDTDGDEYGSDSFKYKNINFTVGYDAKTGITYSVYIFPGTVSFTKYMSLLGLTREKVTRTMNETPDAVDDGLQFRKAGIGVWFAIKAGIVSAESIITENETIDFNGVKIGDNIDRFAKVFGKPVKEGKDEDISYAVYKYNSVYLAVTYSAETRITGSVRIYRNERG